MMRASRKNTSLAILLVVAFLSNPLFSREFAPCSDNTDHSCCSEEKETDVECHADLSVEEDTETESKGCKFCNSLQPVTHSRNSNLPQVSKKTTETPLFTAISNFQITNYNPPSPTSLPYSYHLFTSQIDLYLLHSQFLL